MLLQRMMYPLVGKCEELYYDKKECRIVNNNEVLFDSANSSISYCSYFNLFSYCKWKKYTRCTNLALEAWVKGDVEIAINSIEYKHGQLSDKEYRVERVVAREYQRTEIDLSEIQGDFIGVTVTAQEALSSVRDIAFIIPSAVNISYDDVRIGMCICTYKREKEVLDNVKLLRDRILDCDSSVIRDRIEVFVADNGCTLAETKNNHINIFHNRNYGGSGGFTRAAIEALKSDVTHVLFMDDDVSFEPDVIERTYSFLSLLKPEYSEAFLGGAMLTKEVEYLQHAAGETDSIKGISFDKKDFDMRKLERICACEEDAGSNYLAWWYCAIPRKVFEQNGFSYPMFVQYDDIEFSIRNSNCTKINVNGIAVWHNDFEQKRSGVKDYYSLRNRLISHSICYGDFLLIRRWAEFVLKAIGRLRRGFFFEAMLIINAGFDYLKGPEYICNLDLEQKNSELYAFNNRNDSPAKIMAWMIIPVRLVKLFFMLLLNRRKVIRKYRDTLSEYTSQKYWESKLGVSG